MNYTMRFVDYLKAHLGDSRIGGISEKSFFEDGFFCETDSFKKYKEKLDNIVDEISTLQFAPLSLVGYKGTGKTTFIRWYMKQDNRLKKANKLLLDMDSIIVDNIQNDDVFLKYFKDILQDRLRENNASSVCEFIYHGIINNRRILEHQFSAEFWQQVNQLTSENITKEEYFGNLVNILTNYKDLFLLFLLSYDYDIEGFSNIYGKQEKQKETVIIFDNIDHQQISDNDTFVNSIGICYDKFREILKKINRKQQVEYLFVFSVRDTFHSVWNPQRESRAIKLEPIIFQCSEDVNKIINKRIECAENSGLKAEKEKINYLKHILDSERLRETYLPIFNLDVRRLVDMVMSQYYNPPQRIREIVSLVDQGNLLEEQEKKSYLNGYRGVLHRHLTEYLIKKDFLQDEILLEPGQSIFEDTEERAVLNPARLLLTVICSKGKFAMNKKTLIHKSDSPVGLLDLYEKWSEIFIGPDNADLFFQILTKFFLYHKEDKSHLVIFENKKVINESSFNDEKWLLINKRLTKQGLMPAERSKLNDIKVKITPAGYMYLQRIVTHYEFFSLRADNITDSLFLSSLQEDIYSKQISTVWNEQVKPCLDSLLNYIKRDPDFKEKDFCLNVREIDEIDGKISEGEKRPLYIRIIHTHLRYIDNYRCYLMTCKVTENYTDTAKLEINSKLLDCQEQYINHLKQLYDFNNCLVCQLYASIIEQLEKQKKDKSKYIPLLIK